MEPHIQTRLDAIEAKLDSILVSVERMRRYFTLVFWITIAMIVLPVLGLIIAIPILINMYAGMMSGLI